MSVDERTWRAFDIPGSAPAVSLARLDVEASKAFTVLVRFPVGWHRAGPGYYDAAEEVLFLSGGFRMSGQEYAAGDYGWFPAGYERIESASDTGALALAWFSRPYEWTEHDSPERDAARAGALGLRWSDLPPSASPLGDGTAARLLRTGTDRTVWMLDHVPAGTPAPAPAALLSLPEPHWTTVAPGDPLPALAGPAFCRLQTFA